MAATHSDQLKLTPDTRAALLSGLVRTIDAFGGSLAVHHGTFALLARREDDERRRA